MPVAPGREFPVVFEDDHLLAIDKPAGVAVHGGSGESFGVIEQLRRARPAAGFLELVHRLDKETSGLLLVAKTRKALVALQNDLRSRSPERAFGKTYAALVAGAWPEKLRVIDVALHKYLDAEGTRRVRAVDAESADGRRSITLVRVAERFAAGPGFSLLDVTLKTGRTHQIRVHLADAGHVIVGDPKYGDFALNKGLARGTVLPGTRFERMFLHARRLSFVHPASGRAAGARSAAAGGLRPAAAGAAAGRSAAHEPSLRPDRVRLGRHPVRFDPAHRPLHPGRLCRRRHPVPSDRDASYVIGLGLGDALRHAAPELAVELYPELAERYRHHYLASLDDIVLFDGTLEMLEDLKQRNHSLAVATGKNRRGLDDALRRSVLGSYFDATRTADETASKPDPLMLHELMRELGAGAERTLMIGDTTHDLQLAANAGCASVAVSFGAHSPEEFARFAPLHVAHSTADLAGWLARHA